MTKEKRLIDGESIDLRLGEQIRLIVPTPKRILGDLEVPEEAFESPNDYAEYYDCPEPMQIITLEAVCPGKFEIGYRQRAQSTFGREVIIDSFYEVKVRY